MGYKNEGGRRGVANMYLALGSAKGFGRGDFKLPHYKGRFRSLEGVAGVIVNRTRANDSVRTAYPNGHGPCPESF
jgi:hypothetical protein